MNLQGDPTTLEEVLNAQSHNYETIGRVDGQSAVTCKSCGLTGHIKVTRFYYCIKNKQPLLPLSWN